MNPKLALSLVVSLAFSTPIVAAAPNVENGKKLHDAQCVACHVQQFGGDGASVYTRANRRIKNFQALSQRVAACSAQTGAKWFPEEEADVTAYLNQRFYKFKP